MYKSRYCREKIKCIICDSDKYVIVMYGDIFFKVYGGERIFYLGRNIYRIIFNLFVVEFLCMEICGNMIYGKLCVKILFVFVYYSKDLRICVKMYIIFDD